MTKFQGKEYDNRHGGPFDRGGADNYYRRGRSPHYYIGDTGKTDPITDLTPDELEAYHAGYDHNECHGDKKDWG